MTRRELTMTSAEVLAVPYCGAQALLSGQSRIGHNSGVYGWNWDAYRIGGYAICTGYRNLVGRAANNLAEYERRARQLLNDGKRDQLPDLLQEFFRQA